MLRRTFRITGLTVLFFVITVSPFATAQTVQYHLSVTIPAIPGVNVPPFEDERDPALALSHTDTGLEMIEEHIRLGDRDILLRTYVVR